jgi:gas vesicle protein
MNTTGKVFIGVLSGLAVGTALGILFAPDKGSVTRHKISKRSNEFADDVKKKFGEFTDGVAQQFESIKNEASHLVDKGNEKVEDAKAEFRTAMK